MMTRRSALAVLTLAVVAGGCRSGPRSLVPGEDACAYCRMAIDDVRFGALVITAKGRIQTFDSIECVASYVASLAAEDRPRAIWVANFAHPDQWVDAADAHYLHGSRLRSPMGRELAAFSADADAALLAQEYGGRVLAWPEVTTLMQPSLTGGGPRGHGASTR